MEKLSSPIDKAKSLFRYCPVCQGRLHERKTCDILIYGLTCENAHKFFVPMETVSPENYRGSFLALHSTLKDRDAIAGDWLNNPILRYHLYDYAAKAMRVLLELKENTYDIPRQNEAAKAGIDHFCSLCGGRARMSDIPGDSYSHEVSCANGHRAYERGHELSYFFEKDDARLTLCLDFDYINLFGNVKVFTTQREYEEMIAPQVREILKQYADEFLKDNPTA